MSIPTASELAKLRSRDQRTKLWLSIYQPSIVMQAMVTGTFGQGNNVIPYYNMTVTGTAVYGQTLLVGTSAGAHDVGTIRIRSMTGSCFTVAENNDIMWNQDQYLTVLNYHQIWPVFPKMVTDGAGNTVWYKDYDLTYVNQNSVLGTFVNMGPHFAGFRTAGVCQPYFSASGSMNVAGSNPYFVWNFPGSTTPIVTGTTPGYVSYNTPGHYVASCTAVAPNGGSDTSYRCVSIYDRPENGTNNPILEWGLQSFEGSRDNGGYSAHVWVRQSVKNPPIVDGALCVIFEDTWWNHVKQDIGGNAPNSGSILFCGYIDGESVHYDWEKSYVEFEILSPTGLMNKKEGFSVALNSVLSPGYWYEMADMDCERAMYHYLKWHSTVLDTTDAQFVNYDNRKIAYFDADRTSLYSAISTFTQSTLLGQVVSDRQGTIWFEIEAGLIPNASGTVSQNQDILRQDWVGEPNFSFDHVGSVSYVEIGGIAYTGAVTGTNTAFLSGAPGAYVPSYGGSSQTLSGMALISQDQLNTLTGDYLAWKGNHLSDISLDLSFNAKNLDIAPQEEVFLTLNASDTVRGYVWNRKPFIVESMSAQYNPSQQSMMWSVTAKPLTKGIPGSTIIIPPTPPDDWNMNVNIPNITLPSIPPLILPSIPTPNQTVFMVGPKKVGANYIYTLGRSDNFLSASPAWKDILPDKVSGTFSGYTNDPFQAGKRGYYLNECAMWELTNMDTTTGPCTATLIKTTAQMASEAGGVGPARPVNVVASLINPGEIWWTFQGNDRGWICHRATYSAAPTYVSLGAANVEIFRAFNDMGFGTTRQNYMPAMAVGASDPLLVYVGLTSAGGSSDKIYVSRDGGVNWSYVTGSNTAAQDEGAWVHVPRVYHDTDVWMMGRCDNSSPYTSYLIYSSNRGVDCSNREYAGIQSMGEGGGYLSQNACVISAATNPQDVVALVLRNVTKHGNAVPHLIASTDCGNSWHLQHTFLFSGTVYSGSDRVRGLRRDPYYPTNLYLTGNATDGYVLYSSNKGVTWQQKEGNWAAIMGCHSCYVAGGSYYLSWLFPVF